MFSSVCGLSRNTSAASFVVSNCDLRRLAMAIPRYGTAGRIQEFRASGHVVLSEAETTRLLDRPQVAATAHVLSLGERTPYMLLHPAAPARPFFTHAPMPKDNLGHFAVTGPCVASVDGNEGVADELLVPSAPGPARPHAHEFGIRCQDGCHALDFRGGRDLERQSNGSLTGTVARQRDGERGLRRADEEVLDMTWANDDMSDGRDPRED
jgi:hypothetical protein